MENNVLKSEISNLVDIAMVPEPPEAIAISIRTSLAESAKKVGFNLIHAATMLPDRTFK